MYISIMDQPTLHHDEFYILSAPESLPMSPIISHVTFTSPSALYIHTLTWWSGDFFWWSCSSFEPYRSLISSNINHNHHKPHDEKLCQVQVKPAVSVLCRIYYTLWPCCSPHHHKTGPGQVIRDTSININKDYPTQVACHLPPCSH